MDEVTRRRIAALLLLATAVVAVLAIADAGPFDEPPTVADEVALVVDEFFTAAATGNAARFCDLLTDDARAGFRGQVATLTGEDRPPGCERGFEVLRASLEGSELEIRDVSVSGNRARVEARFRPAGGAAQPRTVELLEERGGWRIDDPG